MKTEKRLACVENIWQLYMKKGYLTNIEATTLLEIAKSWGVETQRYLHNQENNYTILLNTYINIGPIIYLI